MSKQSFWKVRVHLPGGVIHVASATVPVIERWHGRISDVTITPMRDAGYGDVPGYIDWTAVVAVTWRKA